jgi:hypothetical protein
MRNERSFVYSAAIFMAALMTIWSTPARAGVVVEVNGASTGSLGISQGSQAGATTFTTGMDYVNVHIFAMVGFGPATGDLAFLTTSLGAGTTAGDQVAAGTFSVPTVGAPSGMTDVLDLPSLSAGTYFLSIFGGPAGTFGWDNTSSPSTTLDTGASVGLSYFSLNPTAGYLPGSPFTPNTVFQTNPIFEFEVTGTVAESPEPAAFTLFGLGAAALAVLRRRRRV